MPTKSKTHKKDKIGNLNIYTCNNFKGASRNAPYETYFDK